MAASPAQGSAFPYAEFFAKRRRLDPADEDATARAQHAEAGSSYAQLNSDGEGALLPAHRIVLSASEVLAAELDRWKSDNENSSSSSSSSSGRQCVELVVPSGLDSADAVKVQHVFVESLYRGAAAALVDASPQVVLGVLRMADYYQADHLLESACNLLLETFTSNPHSTWASDGQLAAAATAAADTRDASAPALARGVLGLPDEIRQQAAVAGLIDAAADCIAATLPSDLEAAWQPWQEELRDQVLNEPCAEVVRALLQHAGARGLAPNTAYAVAARWCESRPKSVTARERRTVLEGVPLTGLSNNYFTTVFLGSPMASAVTSSELPALLMLRNASQQGLIMKCHISDDINGPGKGLLTDTLPAAWRIPVADNDRAAADGNRCTIELDVPVTAIADAFRHALLPQQNFARRMVELPDSVPMGRKGAMFVNGWEVWASLGVKRLGEPQGRHAARISIYLSLASPNFEVGGITPAALVEYKIGYVRQNGRVRSMYTCTHLALGDEVWRPSGSSQLHGDILRIGVQASPEGAVRALRDAGMVLDEVLKLQVKIKVDA